jgi:hypothetical protein
MRFRRRKKKGKATHLAVRLINARQVDPRQKGNLRRDVGVRGTADDGKRVDAVLVNGLQWERGGFGGGGGRRRRWESEGEVSEKKGRKSRRGDGQRRRRAEGRSYDNVERAEGRSAVKESGKNSGKKKVSYEYTENGDLRYAFDRDFRHLSSSSSTAAPAGALTFQRSSVLLANLENPAVGRQNSTSSRAILPASPPHIQLQKERRGRENVRDRVR